jgi:hypothetical protein
MNKLSLLAIAPLATLLSIPAASAQQCAGHCSQCQAAGGVKHMYSFEESYRMNSMWPQQYVAPSRRGYCQAFELQIANGWRRNNLLGKYDFLPDGSGLSEAGRLRIQWILTQAPPHRRTIFVQRAANVETTAQRVEFVHTLMASMSPGVAPADVQETYLQDDGRPATSVDAVFTGFGANQPPPVLPTSGGEGSSEGS